MNHPYVSCYINQCVHNQGKYCMKKTISIDWKGSSEFRCGERICYPVCEDFEEREGEDD